MENSLTFRKSAALLAALLLLTLSMPAVPVHAAEQYTLYGPYFEDGTRDYTGVDVTFFREGEGLQEFFLNGSQVVTAADEGVAFKFDLGYNVSRTMYVYGNETIYAVIPTDPFYVYYFQVYDLVGIIWGYLETLININGTDRVVERWDIKNVKGEVPFTLSWGNAYKLRLVCDKGSYVYGSYVAGGTSRFTLAITGDMFPTGVVDRAFSIGAYRYNDTTIRAYYSDTEERTNWAQFEFYESGSAVVLHAYNTTSQTVTYDWNEAASDEDYYAKITINHQDHGTLIYSYACPMLAPESENPWTHLRELGTFPIDPALLPALFLILCVFGIFSWLSAPVGIVSTAMVTLLMRYFGWIDISWTWLGISIPLSFLIAFIMWKEREPNT